MRDLYIIQDGKFRVSNNSLTNVASKCMQKFEFTKLYSLARGRGSAQTEIAPGAGIALHRGYQSWLMYRDEERAIFDMMCDYPTEANADEYDDRSMEACYITLMQMINNFGLLEYEVSMFKFPDGEERAAIEVPFEIVLKNFWLDEDKTIPVSYIGFVDAYLYSAITDTHKTVDIKTHRNNLNDLTPLFANSEQCIPYALVLEHLLGNSLDNFDVDYISCYVDIMKPKIQLYQFTKDRQDIVNWMQGFIDKVSHIKNYYQSGWFPKNGDSCLAWRKPCNYFDLCSIKDKDSRRAQITMMQEILQPKEGDKPAEPFVPWVTIELDVGLPA